MERKSCKKDNKGPEPGDEQQCGRTTEAGISHSGGNAPGKPERIERRSGAVGGFSSLLGTDADGLEMTLFNCD